MAIGKGKRRAILAALIGVGLLVVGRIVSERANRGVLEELEQSPSGARAARVMALRLPSGRTLPVNYFREGDWVYAGADFPWWRQLSPTGSEVELLLQGERLRGQARAIRDDPALRASVFERLRPTAPLFTGTLVAIRLEAPE